MRERLTDRPDAPGVWTNGKTYVEVSYDAYGTELWFQSFGNECDYQIDDLPAGGWSQAVPAARVAELESENAELKRELSLANSRFDMAAGIAMDALKEGNAP